MARSMRTLVFGLFVLSERTALTGADVVALGRTVGLSPSNVRSQLSRMVARGELLRRGPARSGVYAPSTRKHDVMADVRFRIRGGGEEPWGGAWWLLVPEMPGDRTRRARLLRRLRFDGFAAAARGLFVRPTWPEEWTRARVGRHLGDGGGLAFRGRPFSPESAALAERLYALDRLERAAARSLAALRRGYRAVRSPAEAFALRARLGEAVIRTIAHDPVLPPEIWGGRRSVRRLAEAYAETEERLAARARPFLAKILGVAERRMSGTA
jgi:DNA-binding transcriptional regulator PaaX